MSDRRDESIPPISHVLSTVLDNFPDTFLEGYSSIPAVHLAIDTSL